MDENGAYTVDVTDQSGMITSVPVYLYIQVNPVVVVPPLSQTVVAGRRVTLSTEITGNPPPFFYEWRLGSTPVLTNTSNERMDFYSFIAPPYPTNVSYRVVVRNAGTPPPGASHPALAVVTVLADTDLDGIPDSWETSAGLDPGSAADALLDKDGDGLSNRDEYQAGTDPNDPASYLRIDQVGSLPGSLSFLAVSNKTYTIQFKDDLNLAAWQRLADVAARTTNRVATVVDPASSAHRTYRLVTPHVP